MNITINHEKTYNTINAILNDFGFKGNTHMKGGIRIPGKDMLIWWPNPESKDWVNETFCAPDGGYARIEESHIDKVTNKIHLENVIAREPHVRCVFMRERWWNPRRMSFCGRSWLRAIGVYELDVEDSRKKRKLVWVRKSKDIEIEIP